MLFLPKRMMKGGKTFLFYICHLYYVFLPVPDEPVVGGVQDVGHCF